MLCGVLFWWGVGCNKNVQKGVPLSALSMLIVKMEETKVDTVLSSCEVHTGKRESWEKGTETKIC